MKKPSGRDKLRYTKEYQIARRNVLRRDNYKCQYPGCKSRSRKYLQVHHIIRVSNSLSLLCREKNMITLCYIHHKSISKKEHHFIQLFSEIVRRKYGD